jgi:cytochrome c peroxidase
MNAKLLASGLLALLAAAPALASSPGVPAFTEGEVRAILSHGPWPAPATVDSSNRVSGKRDGVLLGERLFFDKRLSASGRFACASCHVPERNWTDNQVRGAALAEVNRNTPTLMNARLGRWYGWDGGADSLWAQSIRPILDTRELGADPRHVAELVRKDEELSCRYRKTFGGAPSAADDEAVLVDIAKALAAFQETFETPATPFDQFRNALARGDSAGIERYSDSAKRGLRLFIGKAECSSCHSGPNFSNGEFRNNGFSALAGKRPADPGRVEGLKHARDSRFNLLSRYNDDPAPAATASARQALHTQGEAGAFKVPTLRHLMLTAPYGHHGEIESLSQIVRHYSGQVAGRPGIRGHDGQPALNLSRQEQSDLVVFLESLSTLNNPWRPEDMVRCRD